VGRVPHFLKGTYYGICVFLCKVRVSYVWPNGGGVMVKALACDSRGRQSGDDLRQVVHTRASVTKQYRPNLVPVAGQRCSATGKVTVCLASHWPCVTDLSGLSTYGLKA